MEICGDNRFEIIAKAKADLLEGTNIETDEAEMAVIDNILFRCWQMGWLDRYDEPNSSEKPNNSTKATISKMEQVDKDINVRSKDEPQTEDADCDKCIWSVCNYNKAFAFEDEPQTDTEIAKAIVHKMIDDAVIAEDAYPDLRQKMHDAVDEYEPQTDCAWK